MAQQTKFFNCFSKNLNEYLKAVGLRYMSKQVHVKGISIGRDGNWTSYSSLKSADEQEKLGMKHLTEVHGLVNAPDSQGNYVDELGIEYAKRSRFFWTYLITPELEEALENWRKTGPRSETEATAK